MKQKVRDNFMIRGRRMCSDLMISNQRARAAGLFLTLFIYGICSASDQPVAFTTVLINGHELKFIVDTGTESSVIFKHAVSRVNANTNSETNDAECEIQIGTSVRENSKLAIVEAPPVGPAFDGILGWDQLSSLITEFDWDNGIVRFSDKVPNRVSTWQHSRIRKDAPALILESGQDDSSIILIDTGSESGVGLCPVRWQQWNSRNVKAPMTLAAMWNFHDGPIVTHQSLTTEIKIGPIGLKNVMVEEAQPMYTSLPQFEAVVGAAALCHYEVIIDGPHGEIYLNKHKGCKAKFTYNRIGAVFIPDDSGTCVAHVIANSPADRAGIRNGDKFLSINGAEISDASGKLLSLSRYLNAKAGEEVSIVVRRDGRELIAKIKLEDILGVETDE